MAARWDEMPLHEIQSPEWAASSKECMHCRCCRKSVAPSAPRFMAFDQVYCSESCRASGSLTASPTSSFSSLPDCPASPLTVANLRLHDSIQEQQDRLQGRTATNRSPPRDDARGRWQEQAEAKPEAPVEFSRPASLPLAACAPLWVQKVEALLVLAAFMALLLAPGMKLAFVFAVCVSALRMVVSGRLRPGISFAPSFKSTDGWPRVS